MGMDNNFEQNAKEILDGTFSSLQPTSSPEVLTPSEETAVGTLVIIVISAILSITLLFALAVFIDWRHQKLINIKSKQPTRNGVNIRVPRFGRNPQEDEDTFADKMHTEDTPSSSTDAAVIV